jgi:amino acid transporter
MLVTASVAGMLTWLAGPSKGLLLISRQEGYLPPFLQRLNKNGVQQNILVALGLGLLVPFLFYRSRKPTWRLAEAQQPEVSAS